jgi:DDE superfamily endonuclease
LFYFNVLFYFSPTAHPKSAQADLNLKSIQIAFFPANMTSVVQPMDLGIIKCLKHHYRHELVLKRLEQMEQKKPLADVNILDSINIISKVWETKVSEQTIANCFRKAGFRECNEIADVDDGTIEVADPSMDTYRTAFEALRLQLPSMVGNFEDYVAIDDGVEFSGRLSDEEILDIVTSNAYEREDIENNLDASNESADVTV